MKKIFSLLFLALLLAGCSNTYSEKKPDDIETVVNQPGVEVVAENLSIPWSIQKAGQVFYISERTGTIARVENGRVRRQRAILEKPLAKADEAGLLGFILDPRFDENKRAFAYYTYTDSRGQFNRAVTLNYDGEQWTEERILLDRIPSAAYHHGGRLKIGSDQKLYITTGDATRPESAQDLSSLNGKILRMNLDGSIPADNPFPNSFVYSYGHRNPQGLAWINGSLYESEHGQYAHDEVNRIKPGANYGWPVIQGTEKKNGMEAPLFQSGEETWAPSGIVTYKDKIYTATLRGNAVREFNLSEGKSRPVITGLGRIRDVYIDGEYLYFVSNNTDGRGNPLKNDDKLYRVLLNDIK